MKSLNVGIIGFGTVGSGVVELLIKKKAYFKKLCETEFKILKVCDRTFKGKQKFGLPPKTFITDYHKILNDPNIDVVIELIGGKQPAHQIVTEALTRGKHVVTANKDLIANYGKDLFALAKSKQKHLYFESAVGAGIPVIKTITEGIVGNHFDGLYGIINGTCNYILTEMSKNGLTFDEALKLAQQKGYAESDPTLDINGMDSAHKLAVMAHLAFGKPLKVKDIYTEGIQHISHEDIEHTQSLGLTIKLLTIAKQEGNSLEVRVHPTLIPQDHPMATINDVFNAVLLKANPLGNILLSGEGAGRFAAASGIISDLVNLASNESKTSILANQPPENKSLKLRKIDDIECKFYLRFFAPDKPGILAKISGILGRNNIGINSLTQNAHTKTPVIPLFMLTDFTTERQVRKALNLIYKNKLVREKPIAIRMEKLW